MSLTNTSGNGVTAFRGIGAGSQYLDQNLAHASTPNAAVSLGAEAGQTELTRRINFGTKAAPTLYMLGTMQLTDQHEFYIAEEERNSLARVHRATPVSRHAELRFEGSMQFERMHELFSMVMGHVVTANDAAVFAGATTAGIVAPTAEIERLNTGDDIFRWTWKPHMDYLTVPQIYTWRYGDNGKFYEVIDVFAKSMDLRYEMNNAVMQSMDLFGKGLVELDITELGLTQDTVHDAVSQLTDVYIDDIGDTAAKHMGNFYEGTDGGDGLLPNGEFRGTELTAKSGLLSSATVTVPSGIEMTRYSSGDLDFSDYSQMVRSLEIEFSMRHSDAGRTELSKYRADSGRGRFVRLVTKGPTAGTLGTSVSSINAKTIPAGTSSTASVTHASGAAFKYFFVIDASILYNEPPQLFTDYNGDDVFTIRGNSYHEPNSNWDRDYAILGQTAKGAIA